MSELMICPQKGKCPVPNCAATLIHYYTPSCDAPCHIKGGIWETVCTPYDKEEPKMKCEYCGVDYSLRDGHACNGKPKMSNPSPRDIYLKVQEEFNKTACVELSEGFDEFMNGQTHSQIWSDPITNLCMDWIKKSHPDWHKWLQDKSLVKRKMVKKVFTADVTWKETKEGFIPQGYTSNGWNTLVGKSGKLTFEYEEEE